MTTPLYIETPQAMDTLVGKLESCDYLAVDTEFQREHTYYPHLALVQLASEDSVACIDPLAFDAHEQLAHLLLDENIIKVFHSCSQDLEVLHYYLGQTPVNIHDTQIANALLSDHQQVSYAALVHDMMAVELDKSQTRTDWLRRPLTARQLAYAADDVIYLHRIYPMLVDRLGACDRLGWFEQDCSALRFDADDGEASDKNLWRRVKGSNRLRRNQLAVVQAVAVWREQIARERDRTRRRILDDNTVIDIALSPPRDRQQLASQISRTPVSFSADQLDNLIETIDMTLSASPDSWPNNRYQVLDGEQKQLLKALQTTLAGAAEQLGIAPGMLYSRKQLEKLIFSQEPAKLLDSDDWRYRQIGERLLQLIENR
jgi:ribonuclease D